MAQGVEIREYEIPQGISSDLGPASHCGHKVAYHENILRAGRDTRGFQSRGHTQGHRLVDMQDQVLHGHHMKWAVLLGRRGFVGSHTGCHKIGQIDSLDHPWIPPLDALDLGMTRADL